MSPQIFCQGLVKLKKYAKKRAKRIKSKVKDMLRHQKEAL